MRTAKAWPTAWMPNKGVDQTALMGSLISAFVARIWLKQVCPWHGSKKGTILVIISRLRWLRIQKVNSYIRFGALSLSQTSLSSSSRTFSIHLSIKFGVNDSTFSSEKNGNQILFSMMYIHAHLCCHVLFCVHEIKSPKTEKKKKFRKPSTMSPRPQI